MSEVCGGVGNCWSRKHCMIFALFFYLWRFPNSWSLRMPLCGEGEITHVSKYATSVCTSALEMLSAGFLPLPRLLCRCHVGSFWAETERQAEHPVSKLCPANFTGRFNKASGTDRTVKLATVTAISKLWIEHCADCIDLETDHQGRYALTFLLAVCHGSSISVQSEMY